MKIKESIRLAFDHYQSGNAVQAEKICREILKSHPDSAEALHLLGLISYNAGDYGRALRNIRKSVRIDPENADAVFDMGNILQEQGETAKAMTSYRKAIKLNPVYAEAYNNLGIALQDSMQLDKAIKYYREAVRADCNYAEAYNNLGVAFREKGRLDEAVTNFQRALLLKPDYANAYHNLVDAIQGKEYEIIDKSGSNVIYAVYRYLYGGDFLQASIKSVSDHVDKIFVFRDDIPRGNVSECFYKGKTVKFSEQVEGIADKIAELDDPKVELIHDHRNSDDNFLTHYVNDIILPNYEKPSVILFLDVDHVFRSDQIGSAVGEFIESNYLFATTDQVEMWRDFYHRLPDRPEKTGAVFCNMSRLDKMPETLKHGGIAVMPKLSACVHNFSFAVSEKTMYWKHLFSIALAQKIGGDIPFEDWYEEKWLKWDYESNNENLDISEQIKIPWAVPYNADKLPEAILEKYPDY